MDSRLQRAIGTPKIQAQAGELVDRSLRALEDLRQLDENLYERFLETRKYPEGPEAAANRLRKLWDDTFKGLLDLLDFCKTLTGEPPPMTEDSDASFDFGDFGESAPAPPRDQLELGSVDFGELLAGLDEKQESDSDRWKPVLDKVSSIEYGLRGQYSEACARREVALSSGEMNQVLGLLDDTTSAASEGVHALVAAVYEAFLPDVSSTSVVPGYLTTLGRALLVRRGLADLSGKLAAHNDVLQSPQTDEHPHALTAVRTAMRQFVSSVVCRAMRAADRWQMVEFERDLSGQPPSVARLTAEGLVKYVESLSSINQREVLVLHDQRTILEMRDALASARQLVDLSPRTARDEMERAYQAAQRLRGRHPATDTLIIQLERYSSSTTGTHDAAKFLERLEAVLAAAAG
ncbi:MAG TPA: hypothetical protein VIV40_00605 [Kofleriaceae bacterium]